MTGGQMNDGNLSVPEIAAQVAAEGAKRVVVVSDEPKKYPSGPKWPDGITFHHRDDLQAVQQELREIPGCTVLIYDQTCAPARNSVARSFHDQAVACLIPHDQSS